MTTWTTCGSVALFLLTDHPGIESIAVLLGVGLPMTLLATVTLIPAGIKVTVAKSVIGKPTPSRTAILSMPG